MAAVFALALLGAAEAAAADLKAKVDQIVEDFRQTKKPVGLVIGVLPREGEPAVFGYGKVAQDKNQIPDGDTIFEIGSITKVFTTLLLADMVRRGEAKLDDPVRLYLPDDVKVPKRGDREITLLDLATHSSGLPVQQPALGLWIILNGDVDNPLAKYAAKDLYHFLSHYELPRDVGAKFEYSNWGMGLLGHALALRAKTSYEKLVVERICTPLGMKDTRITLAPEQQSRFAQGHDKQGQPAAHWDVDVLAGMGALRSSANDMLKFLAAISGRTETKLLPAMRDCHTRRRSTDVEGESIGLAWMLGKLPRSDRKVVWHNGGTGGFHSFIGFLPESRAAVVVLANSKLSIEKIGYDVLTMLSAP